MQVAHLFHDGCAVVAAIEAYERGESEPPRGLLFHVGLAVDYVHIGQGYLVSPLCTYLIRPQLHRLASVVKGVPGGSTSMVQILIL